MTTCPDSRPTPTGSQRSGSAPLWRSAAACRGLNPSVFYPGRQGDNKVAKTICAGCPVQPECLETALLVGEKFGVWGGLSERERRRLRRARGLPGRVILLDARGALGLSAGRVRSGRAGSAASSATSSSRVAGS